MLSRSHEIQLILVAIKSLWGTAGLNFLYLISFHQGQL
jgi:hypothetical protein